MVKTARAILVLCITALLCRALYAQSGDDPVIILNATQNGNAGYNYNESVTIVYRLCTAWEGPPGGIAGRDLFKKRRSVKGLKPGEMLQFYPSVFSGSCSDSSGCTAEMISIGDGFYRTTARNKDESKTFDRNRTSSGLPPSTFCSAFILRTADGAILHIKGLPQVSDLDLGYFHGVSDATAEMSKEQRANFLTWKLSEAELDHWENLNRSQSGGAPGPGKGDRWDYTAAVTARVPDLGEVAVEIKEYDHWIPKGSLTDDAKPGDEIVVEAWVCKSGDPKSRLNETAEFTFELEEYGTETGVCCNWPEKPGESAGRPDLAITQKRNPSLNVDTSASGPAFEVKAKTKSRVKEAKAIISSFDFGAWGVLKVTAKDNKGNPMKVTYVQRPDKTQVSIPRDEDANRVADAWQEANDAMGLPATWDEAAVTGQNHKGDGVPLYEKYRGFVVLENGGGERHVRLGPKEKVHFVIDPDNLLDLNLWREDTGVRAFKVLEKWTKDRQVDIHRGFASLKGKWATKMVDRVSPNDAARSDTEMEQVQGNWGTSVPVPAAVDKLVWTPRDVEECRVYVDRIRYDLHFMKANIAKCLTAPTSIREKARGKWLMTLGLTRQEILDRLAGIDVAALEALTKKLVRLVAIHECAHSCGVNGHVRRMNDKDPPKEDVNSEVRVVDCPMQYCSWGEKVRMLLFGEMFGEGTLCDADPQHCWRQLNVKD